MVNMEFRSLCQGQSNYVLVWGREAGTGSTRGGTRGTTKGLMSPFQTVRNMGRGAWVGGEERTARRQTMRDLVGDSDNGEWRRRTVRCLGHASRQATREIVYFKQTESGARTRKGLFGAFRCTSERGSGDSPAMQRQRHGAVAMHNPLWGSPLRGGAVSKESLHTPIQASCAHTV